MANQWDLANLNFDDDDDDGPNGNNPQDGVKNLPKGLRTQLKAMQDQNKVLAEKLAAYDAQTRAGNIEKIVTERKLSPKVARLIPKDLEPTTDAVGKWLDEFTDVFAPPPADENNVDADGDEDASNTVDALQRIARAQSASMPPTKAVDLLAQINDPTMTPDKLMKLIVNEGGGYG